MSIPRLQLFELEDQKWFPAAVRDLATDYLHFMEHRFGLHRHAVPVLARAIDESNVRRVIDLCSGGAGPVPQLAELMWEDGRDVRFTLTDLFPNLEAFRMAHTRTDGRIGFVESAVDARRVPEGLEGLRTFFNAFHHFHPEDAVDILQAAANARQPIAVLEIPERRVSTLLPLFLTPLFVWLATPFIRPMSWRRFLLTYPIPAVPLTCLWDGIVSQMRAYRPEELAALADQVGAADYVWEAGTHRDPTAPGRLTYLLGRPV